MGGLESILSPEFVDAMQRLWGPTGAGLIAGLIVIAYVVGPLMKKNKEQSDPLAPIKAQIADLAKASVERDDEIEEIFKISERQDREIHDMKRDIAQIHRDMDRNAAYERARQEFTRPPGHT